MCLTPQDSLDEFGKKIIDPQKVHQNHQMTQVLSQIS